MPPSNSSEARDHPIYIKLIYKGQTRRFKIPYDDTTADVLPHRIRFALMIPDDEDMILERYSDSAASYILLDSADEGIYRQLRRAARAKGKLRIKVTTKRMNVFHKIDKLLDFDVFSEVNNTGGRMSALSHTQSCVSQDNTSVQHESPTRKDSKHEWTERARQHSFDDMNPSPQPTRISSPPGGRPSKKYPNNRTLQSLVIDCNACRENIKPQTVHYHCGVCEEGDYDLCSACLEKGVLCDPEHWLIKRELSKTKRFKFHSCVSRVGRSCKTCEKDISSGMLEVSNEKCNLGNDYCDSCSLQRPSATTCAEGFDTCNVCLSEKSHHTLAFCLHCKRQPYRVCVECLLGDLHGHNPYHEFQMMDASNLDSSLQGYLEMVCKPGRDVLHKDIICDRCDRNVYGIRHKCLQCPDYDYCRDCFKTAELTHPNHRFASIVEPIPPLLNEPFALWERDEPQSYISGHASARDFDDMQCTTGLSGSQYCDRCQVELLTPPYPGLENPLMASDVVPTENQTRVQPGISSGGPKHSVASSSQQKDKDVRVVHGEQEKASTDDPDHAPKVRAVSEYLEAHNADTLRHIEQEGSTNISAQSVPQQENQFLLSRACVFPVSGHQEQGVTSPPDQIQGLSVPQELPGEAPQEAPQGAEPVSQTLPDAHCISGTIPNETSVHVNSPFTQTWKLYNPGPLPWPVGSAVHFIGGDIMLDHDYSQSLTPDLETLRHGMRSTHALEEEVHPGTSHEFSVHMRVPPRRDQNCQSCADIPDHALLDPASHEQDRRVSYWRLKDGEGREIGQKLWCDVVVQKDAWLQIPMLCPLGRSKIDAELAAPEQAPEMGRKPSYLATSEQEHPEPVITASVAETMFADQPDGSLADMLQEFSIGSPVLKAPTTVSDADEIDLKSIQPPSVDWQRYKATVDAQVVERQKQSDHIASTESPENDFSDLDSSSCGGDQNSKNTGLDGFDVDELEYDMMTDWKELAEDQPAHQ